MYIFVYRVMSIGGCQLLIERLANRIGRLGNSVKILCEKIEFPISEYCAENNIEIELVENWGKLTEYLKLNYGIHGLKRAKEESKVNILTFTWHDFSLCYSSRISRKKTVMYAVHDEALYVVGGQNTFIHRFLRKTIEPVLRRLIIDHNIIVMDELTIKATDRYFSGRLNVDRDDYKIVRISIETEGIKPVSAEEIEHNLAQPHILAVARADFPFKGYIIGLIHWMADYQNDRCYLDIISYGKDEGVIREEIGKLPLSVQQRINLYGKTRYEDLDQIIRNSCLYVGMGTTLLDAAIRGVLSAPVQGYSFDLHIKDFFDADYRFLTIKDGRSEYLTKLMNDICSMEVVDYQCQSQKNVKIVKEHYDIGVNVKAIVDIFNSINGDKKNCIIDFFSKYFEMRITKLKKL